METLTETEKYWRQKAEEYKQSWENEQDEFKEFQLNSKELELELEKQLVILEAENNELKINLENMSIKMESICERNETSITALNRNVSHLQEELTKLNLEKIQQAQHIRKLEQTNDDFERSNRLASASVQDFETRLNQLVEEKALLEGELDEKNKLCVKVQRLKDKVRDLHQELRVRPLPDAYPIISDELSDKVKKCANLYFKVEASDVATQTSLLKSNAPSAGISLNPSTRIIALNLVGDLLQKIGQLESNFEHVCRCYDVSPAKVAKLNGTINGV